MIISSIEKSVQLLLCIFLVLFFQVIFDAVPHSNVKCGHLYSAAYVILRLLGRGGSCSSLSLTADKLITVSIAEEEISCKKNTRASSTPANNLFCTQWRRPLRGSSTSWRLGELHARSPLCYANPPVFSKKRFSFGATVPREGRRSLWHGPMTPMAAAWQPPGRKQSFKGSSLPQTYLPIYSLTIFKWMTPLRNDHEHQQIFTKFIELQPWDTEKEISEKLKFIT